MQSITANAAEIVFLTCVCNMTQVYLVRGNLALGRIGKYVQRSRDCIVIFLSEGSLDPQL